MKEREGQEAGPPFYIFFHVASVVLVTKVATTLPFRTGHGWKAGTPARHHARPTVPQRRRRGCPLLSLPLVVFATRHVMTRVITQGKWSIRSWGRRDVCCLHAYCLVFLATNAHRARSTPSRDGQLQNNSVTSDDINSSTNLYHNTHGSTPQP